MIGRALGLDGNRRDTEFKDVNSNVTALGYIDSAVSRGIIRGFPDNTYRPDAPVTRGQMATFLSKAHELTGEVNIPFKYISPNMAAYVHVERLLANKTTTGYSEGTFRPDEKLTRSHFSVFMARALRLKGEVTRPEEPVKPDEPRSEQDNKIITFSYLVIELNVQSIIGRETGDIFERDVEKITNLVIQNEKITNLNDLQQLSKLRSLELTQTQINDITPLKTLTNLSYLNLSFNNISDISSLRSLINLRKLDLTRNVIVDVTGLKGLNNISTLSLGHNQIENIEPLEDMASLQYLVIMKNKLNLDDFKTKSVIRQIRSRGGTVHER